VTRSWDWDTFFDGSEEDKLTKAQRNDKDVCALWYLRPDQPVSDFFREKIGGYQANHPMIGVVGGLYLFG
jgi:hypothetical protein